MNNEAGNLQMSSALPVSDTLAVERMAWVTPMVSASAINELTESGFVGVGSDNSIYS